MTEKEEAPAGMAERRAQRNAEILAAHNDGVPIVEIARRFGLSLSWTGALLRHHLGADVPETGRGIRCDLDAGQLAEAYNEGASIRKLAAEHEVSYGKVYRVLSAAGVTFRSPRFTRH